MPTASTAQILGNNESFEPYTSNIYLRRVLSGEFMVVNKHLLKDLIALGIWNDKMKNQIIAANGSVQDIPNIPLAGTFAALGLVLHAALKADRQSLVAAPLVGYGAAWFGHVVFERNRPATFGHPLLSALSDFRMIGLFLAGRLTGELSKYQLGRYRDADSTAAR